MNELLMREALKKAMHEATRRRQETAELCRHMDSVVHDAELVRKRLRESYAIAERDEMKALEALEEFNAEQATASK